MSTPPVPVTATVTPAPLPESFDTPAAAALARDLAIGMYDEALILKKAGITAEQYETLKQNEWFQKLVTQLSEEWNQPKNAQQRLAIGAAVGLETVLPDVIARAKVKNEPLQGVAQLVKVIADIAGVGGSNKAPAPPSEKFSITIDLGGEPEVYEKSRPVITVESAPIDTALPEITGGIRSLLTLQTEPEKA